MASDDKKRALDAAIAKLEKDFGKGTVMKAGRSSGSGGSGDDSHRFLKP